MIRYVSGRLIQIVPVLFGVSIIVFLLVRLIPGDPATSMLGSRATPELVARVHSQLGLDLPIWRQYLGFLGSALRGDFGISFFYQDAVWKVVGERVPITLALMGYSLVIATLWAIPFALVAALRRNSASDQAVRLVFTMALGTPSFWLGIILALLLGVKIKLFPITGAGTGGLNTLWHLSLPAITIAFVLSPIIVRVLRSSLVEVIDSDYVMTARAMGLKRGLIVSSYMLRNSFRPVISILSVNIGYLIGGAVITEKVFSIPGVGSLLVGSIATRDYSVIQLATLFFALVVVVVNVLADLAYLAIDPRVSLKP